MVKKFRHKIIGEKCTDCGGKGCEWCNYEGWFEDEMYICLDCNEEIWYNPDKDGWECGCGCFKEWVWEEFEG